MCILPCSRQRPAATLGLDLADPPMTEPLNESVRKRPVDACLAVLTAARADSASEALALTCIRADEALSRARDDVAAR
jgi:hypothetical protein